MDPLFLGEGTCEHVDLLNTQVPDGSEDLLASRCYRGRIMAIRNRVSFRTLFVSAANTSIGTYFHHIDRLRRHHAHHPMF